MYKRQVERYVPPEEFAEIEREAYGIGFKHAVAGPFVRSSYRAWETERLVREAHGLPPAPRGGPVAA